MEKTKQEKMGEKLKDYRTQKLKVSQLYFSQEIGIDVRNYVAWEKGRGINWLEKAIRLETLVGGSLAEFFDE